MAKVKKKHRGAKVVLAPENAPGAKNTAPDAPKDSNKFVGLMMPPEELVIVGLDTQHKDGEHALTDVDRLKNPVDPDTVLSVKVHGVYETIIARMKNGIPEVVNGRQRVRAAREANKQRKKEGLPPIRVPVVFQRMEDREAFAAMITTNEHRLDDMPLWRARKALKTLGYGYSREETASLFKVTPVTIASWEKIADLDQKVIEAIEKNRITLTLAVELAGFKDRDVQVVELEKAIANGTSANQLREEAQSRRRQAAAAMGNGSGNSERSRGDGGDEIERGPKPGAKILRRLVKAREEGEVDFDDNVFRTFRFVLGQLPPRNIKGLVEALKHVGAEEFA